ncbi:MULTISPECIES: hypothetical protein [unclassified Microbacterium]|uniref:hypothetical protein n=1 Tax=unclassified Microbacterium TaxID=2609290 RepID=UPI000CFCE6EA|nr:MULTISPECIES: hypothetical protein [unclassified Microbacterium]PQZ53150.1 hypothetical protein CQ032_15710 [Microbacterium sp. MYb43]PQZ74692.1 hypothetical protein CQ031_15055 [Microbacterium sp. MYb40]PRB18780.1 hypothetical protein CQ040_16360 [Microbacterium sp. MYb54]PRB23640.1 hypothetical protein CQ037_17160 [Microbacterium sp. MYb50]PRB63351.1 hypothetical protein CQ021_16745 [Microbacterium sp. MYb24]
MPKKPDEISIDPVSPEYVVTVARAVLAVDHQHIRTSPVGHTVIGWVLAAHDQILAVGEMTRDGRKSATAPNTRAVLEVALRLIWLHSLDDRAAGLRAQFDGEASHANKHPENLQKMGLPITVIETPPKIDLDQFGTLDPTLKSAARSILNLSEQTDDAGGFYDMWWTSTQFSHATKALADAYAPRDAFGTITAPKDPRDWSPHLNAISMVICAVAGQILMEEGLTPDDARIFFTASATA